MHVRGDYNVDSEEHLRHRREIQDSLINYIVYFPLTFTDIILGTVDYGMYWLRNEIIGSLHDAQASA